MTKTPSCSKRVALLGEHNPRKMLFLPFPGKAAAFGTPVPQATGFSFAQEGPPNFWGGGVVPFFLFFLFLSFSPPKFDPPQVFPPPPGFFPFVFLFA